jgi:hypothetical protein
MPSSATAIWRRRLHFSPKAPRNSGEVSATAARRQKKVPRRAELQISGGGAADELSNIDVGFGPRVAKRGWVLAKSGAEPKTRD